MHTWIKALVASASILILTALHHLYGAAAHDTPWRVQVAVAVPVLVVLFLAFAMHRTRPQEWLGRACKWLFIFVSLTV